MKSPRRRSVKSSMARLSLLRGRTRRTRTLRAISAHCSAGRFVSASAVLVAGSSATGSRDTVRAEARRNARPARRPDLRRHEGRWFALRCYRDVVSQRDLDSYVRAWRGRFASAEREREELAARARKLVPQLVQHLVDRYGVRRVWLFGSLVHGGFHEGSDIDLAVEGLPPGRALFRAGAELDDLARPFRVELVPLDEAWEPVRQKILEQGEVVHGGHA